MPKTQRMSEEEAPSSGAALPARLRRNLPSLPNDQTSKLIKHIMRLQALHPEVHIKFRDVNLVGMDEPTLQLLLKDFNNQLGVD